MNDAEQAGLLLADKPVGISSHAAVARARRALAIRRIGHAGTLDPFASGLLILLVGRATRLARWFVALPKTYEVVVALGYRSSTGDTEGEITPGRMPPSPLPLPRGTIAQRPPAHSAVKVAGERSYRLARRGVAVEHAPREVEIHDAVELWRDGDRAGLRVSCSSGTYIRSLVAELDDAYCVELRRTAIGPFRADGAWPTEGTPSLIEILTGWRAIDGETCMLAHDAALAAANGRAVAVGGSSGAEHMLLLDPSGLPVALAERQGDGTARPIVGLLGPRERAGGAG